LNKKVTLLGQGFSPMKHPLSKRLLKWALNKAQISTRDHYSQTQIEPIPSVCASDLAYFHAKLHPETSLETAQKAPLIGLALHPQLPKSFKSPLMDALHQLPQDFLFLSFFPENDKTLLSEYPDILPKILDHWTPWQHKPTTRPCPTLQHHTIKWLITRRYHGAVWASLKGIPFLAIAADPKLISIAQDLGQPYIDCTPPTSSEEVYKQIQTFIHQYPILRQHLLELTPHLIKKAACHPPLR
jgi:polysaccharide pyruvyl transferase WcaK-like protein